MVFTVFSAYPAFAVTLGLYIFFSKKSLNFSLIFNTFFHEKSMKKWSQEPVRKKIDFWHAFSRFFVDLGTPWGPQGGTFFRNKREKGAGDIDLEPFFE